MMKKFFSLLLGAAVAAPLFGADPIPEEKFRYREADLRLYKLSEKGLEGAKVWNYSKAPFRYKKFSLKYPKETDKGKTFAIPVELLEESGNARTVHARFGVPVARGVLRNLDRLSVVDADGKTVPAGFGATGFWPDQSVKWVLVSFSAPFKANESRIFTIKGNATAQQQPAPGVKLTDSGDLLTVNTGVLSAQLNRKNFRFLEKITVNGKAVGSFGQGELRDEAGTLKGTADAPAKIFVDENTVDHLTLRAEGVYGAKGASNSSWRALITFYANSPVVRIAFRHENSNLEWEFTDLTSLKLLFTPASPAQKLTVGGKEVKRIFQHNDQKLETDGAITKTRMADGGMVDNVTFTLRDAALRYPKAFALDNGKFAIEVLPELPDAKFGEGLPHYLMYPFCEGKHRSKWGMCFTEDMLFDFSGKMSPETLAAPEMVAVIDRAYLYSTKAVEGISPAGDNRFDEWNAAMIAAFKNHLERKEAGREYGYFNYGDSYGERGYNWTNNEYDLAHSFFDLFLRTGYRELFRAAMRCARHQADVDAINYHPSRNFRGAVNEHGLEHSGTRYGMSKQATWSFMPYISRGDNGHTWIRGVLDAWKLAGDYTSADSAAKLAKHMSGLEIRPMVLSEREPGWFLVALSGLYDVTGNEAWLANMQQRVPKLLAKQKPDKGGAWPHKLPGDHAGGFKKTFGNCIFMVGVLCEGLRQYNRVNPDPKVQQSLATASRWLKSCYDAGGAGWPYTACWDGTPYFSTSVGCNAVTASGFMAGGRFAHDPEVFEDMKQIIAVAIVGGADGRGKSLAMDLAFSAGMIDELLAYEKENPGAKFEAFTRENCFRILSRGKAQAFVRCPTEKEFEYTLKADEAEVQLRRIPYGRKPKVDENYTLKITDASGKEVFASTGSTDKAATVSTKLTGKAGDKFLVYIHDDMRSIWAATGKNVETRSKVIPGYGLGCGSVVARQFEVPAGTKEFSITVSNGINAGAQDFYVFDEQGRLVRHTPAIGMHRIKPITVPTKTEMWSFVVTGKRFTRDLGFEFKGIPPYIYVK